MIQSVLEGELADRGLGEQLLVSLISYVVVDPADPAFTTPSKPIGPFYPVSKRGELPFPVVETPRGLRRLVASPRPLTIVEKREIRRLLEMDFIVVCCGGGGIPVIREGRRFQGIDAVIDKDLASARLALEVGVEVLLIATDVPGVARDFGQPGERFFRRLPVAEAARLLREGQFPPGSMGPKVEAALEFLAGGGRRAVICAIDDLERAAAGEAGTEFIPSSAAPARR